MPEQGDILLIPVPFTDLSSQKRRPVVVISNNDYNHKYQDIVVLAVTSNPEATDYSLVLECSDLEKGTLKHPSRIRVDKIFTLSQSIIAQDFGKVNIGTLDRIRKVMDELFSRKP